jgi:hypothetical protein
MRIFRKGLAKERPLVVVEERAPDHVRQGIFVEEIDLEVPFEDKDEAKALGARWNAERRVWVAHTPDAQETFAAWLPVHQVDLGPGEGPGLEVVVFGLPESCWRCRVPGTSLVGMMAPDGDLCSEDLVLCDDALALALAYRALSAAVLTNWRIGTARRHFSQTARSTYLANSCLNCGAARGIFPLFHEAVPEALAEGGGTLARLTTTVIPRSRWQRVFEQRWS